MEPNRHGTVQATFEATPYQWREAERALERDTDLHDEGCDCGACWLLEQIGNV